MKMLFASVVVDITETALHDSPNAFIAVHGNSVADELSGTMADCPVFAEHATVATIAAMFIGVKRRACLNLLMDCGVKDVRFGVQ